MKKFLSSILSVTLLLSICLMDTSFAATAAGQEMRTQVLYLTEVIENDNYMNDYITRAEFAKMLVKASQYKDSVPDTLSSGAYSDVPSTSEYASFIKIATLNGYMPSYLGGLFKPDDYVLYKDVIRGCLALLGYTNDDFKGSQVKGRYNTFNSLKLNTNIDLLENDIATKKDCVNAIYNTFKANKKGGNAYGPSIFTKMSINSDGELNASGLLSTSLEGPFILKRGNGQKSLREELPFDIDTANIFINGSASNTSEIDRELNHEGYLLYYYNKTTKTVYVYKESNSFGSTVLVKRGYINHIYYTTGDTITPNSVEIDLAKYNLGNTETKFAFSYAGTLHVGDQIIFIYEQDNKVSDEDSENDGGYSSVGTITYACLYDVKY